MPTEIPVGIITNAGGAHLGAYFTALAACEEVQNVALSDPSGQCVEEARKTLKDKLAAVYDSPDKMLNAAKPVMALVSVEAVQGPPLIDKALEAGCHVFAEKPACVRAEDFQPLVEKAERKKLNLMLALSNRINPAAMEAVRLIRAGALGKLYGAEVHIVADQTRLKNPKYRDTWFADKTRAGGGHLIWLGIHWLDLVMQMSDARITEVAGFTGNVGGQPLKGAEDSAALALKFENGMFGTFTSGYYLDKGYHTHIRLWGSDGWLEYSEHLGAQEANPLKWYSTKEPKTDGIQVSNVSAEPKGYTPFVRLCVRASAGLEPAPITGRDGLRVLKTIFACYEAVAQGKTIKV